MALEMYAGRRIYVQEWNIQSDDERYTVEIARGGKPILGFNSDRITYVEEEVMYWRKANHIHAWFVDNLQDGVDDCELYHIPWQKLLDLFDRCKRVVEASRLVDGLVRTQTAFDKEHPDRKAKRVPGKVIEDATVAKALLPTRRGCFFGSDEYDEQYLYEVRKTQDWAERMLKDHDAGVPGDMHYQSSW
jgi:hypothetical protein